jgi:hypothetical protein
MASLRSINIKRSGADGLKGIGSLEGTNFSAPVRANPGSVLVPQEGRGHFSPPGGWPGVQGPRSFGPKGPVTPSTDRKQLSAYDMRHLPDVDGIIEPKDAFCIY